MELSDYITLDCENVALRKESVDRNNMTLLKLSVFMVALRKESVDRNWTDKETIATFAGRSPQGERG